MENESFWTEFIEVYREQRCLWDVRSSDYTNKNKRSSSYAVLLAKLKEIDSQVTVDTVKRKINNMRTTFRREVKKVHDSKRTGSGGEMYEPTLWYYNLLQFTVQSECGRTGTSNDEPEENIDNNIIDLSQETIYSPEEPDTPIFDTGAPSQRKRTKSSTSDEKKRKQLLDFTHNALSTEEDEDFIAGRRIGYQLKGLGDHQKAIAEKLISDVVYYAKMGRLTEESVVKCTPDRPNIEAVPYEYQPPYQIQPPLHLHRQFRHPPTPHPNTQPYTEHCYIYPARE